LDPLAFATAVLAALHILWGAPPIVAPSAAIVFERRLLYPTPARLRIVGVSLLALVALPLILAVRDPLAPQGGIALWLAAYAWLSAASLIWPIVAPASCQRFAVSFWDAIDEPAVRRIVGLLSVAFGLCLGWLALSVL